MTLSNDQHTPAWIWHPGREEKKQLTLSKRFTTDRKITNVRLVIALTGAVSVELNGEKIAGLTEHPGNVAKYHELDAFPRTLEAGQYMIRLVIECRHPMPVGPVSIHLRDRTMGCSAYLEGENFWLATDETWTANDESAAMVCLYGEEPYGDLENSPDWFVQGGYGDIAAGPIPEISVMSSHVQTFETSGKLQVRGTHTLSVESISPTREQLHQFYHLRKQSEWAEMRARQKSLNLSRVPCLQVDLLKEYNVRFRVSNDSKGPVTLLWNGAESLEEMEHYDGCITEWFHVGSGERSVTLPQGMRYIDLYLFGKEGETFSLQIEFEAAGVPMNQVGRVQSDSDLFNRIYDVSVHTNKICHQLGLWDGIKRDRLNWAYDFYLAAKADYVLWDDLSVLRRSIRELGKGTPYGYWMNSIDAYTLWWMVNLWEYYWFTGDKVFLLDIRDDIQKHMNWIEANLDPETGYFRNKHTAFLEWVPMETEESWTALHGLLALTIQSLTSLSKYIPELEIRVDWKLPHIPESAFLEESKALITPLLGISSGYVGRDRAIRFLEQYEPADPITPLSAYWLAESCAQHGLMEKAWEVIRKVWGGMLDYGCTTFWESVRLTPADDIHDSLTTYTAYDSYRISLCHAWSSTPVQWISRFVLGIEPIEPGYAKIRFQPHVISGMTRCQGSVNTPCGKINVEWGVESDGDWTKRIDLPNGVVLEPSDTESD